MSFLNQEDLVKLKENLISDSSLLGKLYKARKSKYLTKSVNHSLVDGMVAEGWEEYGRPLKTKSKLRIPKEHNKQFEDDIWCQLYELGYRCLNLDENLFLPYGKASSDKKQIDVAAVGSDTIILIECKSSMKPKKAQSLKTEFEGLGQRLAGFRKSLEQLFGKNYKIKYVFATRNLRIDIEGPDIQRLHSTNSFFYNDNTYEYINSLLKSYKSAALYQFLGLVFKDQLISNDRIEVPAIQGEMGGKKYYMFSIEPSLLLKMGFILHRTKANESEMPTYQRLLVPKRLTGITKFINEGGYFPNSIILNFYQKKNKIQFEHASRGSDTHSRYGMLKIPNAYAIAYIIDGQHRVYGYANSDYNESNTIPVVAFTDLDSTEQLEIFMDINENQKSVSASLRLTLEEDLYWESDRADSRIKALRSSIIRELANSINGPLFNKISVGEDPSILAFKPFANSLLRSGLLPIAKGNKFETESTISALYDTNNQNHKAEMEKSKKHIVKLLNLCYGFIEENYPDIYERDKYFIISNRGSYAFVSLIGSLNKFEVNNKILNLKSSSQERFDAIEKYLVALIEGFKSLKSEEEEKMLTSYGTGGDIRWFRFFQNLVNKRFPEYNPPELIDWKERQDDELQAEGRSFGIAIEKHIKQVTLDKIKTLFTENWELEINSIKRECLKRAEEEMERFYKEFNKSKEVHWTEMFNITDYKTIIEKYWGRKPVGDMSFKTFQDEFSIDMGFEGKKPDTKWISLFNSYRNLWAHEGTKEKRLNKEEVKFLEQIYNILI